jgi:hypothetical protein
MKTSQTLAMLVFLLVPTVAFANNARTKAEPVQTARKVPPPVVAVRPVGILRQDLFDRNNPNNLRSDYHGPPLSPASSER